MDKSQLEESLNKLDVSNEAKMTILKAITEPVKIDEKTWKRLVDLLVSKGTSGMKIGRISAKICNDLAHAEFSLLPDDHKCHFRPILLTNLQREYKKLVQQDCRNVKALIGFINFLCAVFDLMHINNMPFMALVTPVYEVLGLLSQVRFAGNEDAIQCLVTQLQFVGEELDRLNKLKMEELFDQLRTVFLNDNASQLSRLMLLEIIELRSGGWKLSPSAYQYYYEGAS